MRVRYLFHSGFLMETARAYYLFDYFGGDLPRLDPAKPVTVLASHGHKDHYDPAVFSLLRAAGAAEIFAVLAKDIPPRRHPKECEVLRAYAGQTYALPHGETLETLLSTDSGVAYLLTADGGTVYHAGDLNDWSWEGESEAEKKQMRGNYRHEIDRLRGRRIDVACVPLDPRLTAHYADGLLYFLSAVDAGRVYPMHYWQQPEVIGRFLTEYPQYASVVQNTEQEKER